MGTPEELTWLLLPAPSARCADSHSIKAATPGTDMGFDGFTVVGDDMVTRPQQALSGRDVHRPRGLGCPFAPGDCSPTLAAVPQLCSGTPPRTTEAVAVGRVAPWDQTRTASAGPVPLPYTPACDARVAGGRPLGVLPAVVQSATLAGFASGSSGALGRAVALALLGDDDAWHVPLPLEQLAKNFLGGVLVPVALPQASQYVIGLVDSAPQGMALAMDGQADSARGPWPLGGRVDVAADARHPAPTCDPMGGGLSMGDVDPACAQQLYLAVAQREAPVEPAPMADDLAGATVVFVTCGGSRWRHVWLPIGVLAWFVRGHHRSEYLTGQGSRGQQLDNAVSSHIRPIPCIKTYYNIMSHTYP